MPKPSHEPCAVTSCISLDRHDIKPVKPHNNLVHHIIRLLFK